MVVVSLMDGVTDLRTRCSAESRFTKKLRETFVMLHEDGQLVWRHDQFSQLADGCLHLPVQRPITTVMG